MFEYQKKRLAHSERFYKKRERNLRQTFYASNLTPSEKRQKKDLDRKLRAQKRKEQKAPRNKSRPTEEMLLELEKHFSQ